MLLSTLVRVLSSLSSPIIPYPPALSTMTLTTDTVQHFCRLLSPYLVCTSTAKMVTTRSGKSTVTTKTNSHSLFRHVRKSNRAPIAKIPVEILQLIVSFLLPGSTQAPCLQSLRPSALYPLARSCKGSWACLGPLLYYLDVQLERHRSESIEYSLLQKPPLSALLWALKNKEPTTADLAISTAQSMGQLQHYAEASFRCPTQVSWPPHQDLSVAPTVNMDLNAIFLAAQGLSLSRPQWCADDEGTFTFLASQNPCLLTKDCSMNLTRETPLALALESSFPASPLERKRFLGLIRIGALGIRHPGASGASRFFSMWSESAATSGLCQFQGECFDAALEHYGETPDAVFLGFWEEGIRNELPLDCSFK